MRTRGIWVGMLALAAWLGGAQGSASDARGHAKTIVSLEFDHAFSNQLPAVQAANSRGMRVTLFAMSGRVGTPGYMTADQLLALQTNGDEIGGHTIDHPDLAKLDLAAQRHEICDDRASLQADGLEITDFAYPYGYLNRATPRIVRNCGYQSARIAGGLGRGSDCGHPCPWAETIPPRNRFQTRAESSVLSSTSLATLKRYVTKAEQTGGGWVQIVFHQVCDGCDPYSVTEDRFGRFVAWLARRRGIGTTERTVRQVLVLSRRR